MGLRVLLVEDNVLNQELARDLLELAGHVVTVAHDGDALRTIVRRETTPNIVLMDVLLPGTDGVTLLHELRALADFRVVPIIAVTAQALSGDQQRLFDAGFDGVLTKPIDTRTFVADVEKYAIGQS
jgi:CheY-like chemotaxis protein